MTAITSGTSAESRQSIDVARLRSILTVLAGVGVAVVVVLAAWSAITRIQLLLGWNETFSSTGTFTVVACEPDVAFGPDRWMCDGRLTTSAATDVSSQLIVGKDAVMSARPYIGQQVAVFFAASEGATPVTPDIVYADDSQLSELSRLYLALPPLIMIVIGGVRMAARCGRSGSPGVALRADAAWWHTSPLFRDLRRRGVTWLLVGAALLVLHQLAVVYVLGSAGVG